MRRAFMAAAAIALLGMTSAAQAITLGTTNIEFLDASNMTTLSLEAIVPGGNQPTNAPCLICGTSQPQQPVDFGYNNFKQGGNQTTINAFSDGTATGNNKGVTLADNVIGVGYTVGSGSIFRDFLEAGGGIGTHTFSVGIDANQTSVAQTLESFFFLNLTQRTILAAFTGGVTGNLAVANNGSGFPDFTLTGFDLDLGDILLGDTVAFFARITGANDGAESFFLMADPNAVAVPLPAGIWMFGAALTGLGALKMRSRKRKNVTTFDAAA